MSRHRRSIAVLGPLALLMLVLLAACGGDGGGGSIDPDELRDQAGEIAGDVEDAVGGGNGDAGGGDGGGEPGPSEPAPAPAPSEPAPAQSEPAGSQDDGIEAWVWAVIAIAAVAVLILVFVAGRGTRDKQGTAATRSLQERQQILISTLSGWTAHGWVIESQSAETAVLRKGAERRQVTIDEYGRAFQHELPASGGAPPPDSPPARSGDQPPS